MKVQKLLAALAVCSALVPAAYADTVGIVLNGEEINIDAQIIDNRTMINVDSLSAIGIDFGQADGIYTFTKGGNSLQYDERTEEFSADSGEKIICSRKPILTSNERLVPMREVAENLGIGVGWDENFRKAALIDFDEIFDNLKLEDKAVYDILNFKIKSQTAGTSTGNVNLTAIIPVVDEYGEPSEGISLEVKLSADESINDGIEKSSATVEKFSYTTADSEFSLANASFDVIYDTENSALYIKTNLLTKIAEKFDNGMLDAISKNFTEDTWYKITFQEFFSFLNESIFGLGEVNAEMYNNISKSAYADGLSIADTLSEMYSNPLVLNNVDSYSYIQAMIDSYRYIVSSGIMSLEPVGESTLRFTINLNADTIVALLSDIYADGFGLTEAEAAEIGEEIRQSIAGINFKMSADIDNRYTKSFDMTADIDIEGLIIKGSADMVADFAAKTEKVQLPQAIELLPLLDLIADNYLPDNQSAIGIIGGADGPTAIYVN